MTVSPREKRLILLAIPALLLAFYILYSPSSEPTATATIADTGTTAMAEKRATLLRQIVATIPAREAVLKQTSFDLTDRERGIIQADTYPQAQAALLEIARRVGKAEQLDIRSGEFGQPKAFTDYGLVFATISFDCHIDQLVNFLASLSHQTELVVPYEERISSGNPKDKVMGVRITLAGIVNKKLIPEKKGLAAF